MKRAVVSSQKSAQKSRKLQGLIFLSYILYMFLNDPLYYLYLIPAFLIAFTVHEWAHAYAATILGDDTSRRLGRLTLNPIAHIDPLGALSLLLVGFGWGRPVPVNPRNFGHPRRDYAIVAFVGPLSNLILVGIFAVILKTALVLVPEEGGNIKDIVENFCAVSISINIILAVFNLFPIPPLDGSNILLGILPESLAKPLEAFYGRVGSSLLLVLIIAEVFLNIPLISAFVYEIYGYCYALVMLLIGVGPQ